MVYIGILHMGYTALLARDIRLKVFSDMGSASASSLWIRISKWECCSSVSPCRLGHQVPFTGRLAVTLLTFFTNTYLLLLQSVH